MSAPATEEIDDFSANMPVVKVRKQKKEKAAVKSVPGVVYLGRIPHGFYEEEMNSYFSQFGTVSRLRLSRNKKTGASKHYAFIEFESKEVAKIVVETMHNYLLSNRLLQCKLLEDDQVHPELFKGANQKFKQIPWNKIQRLRQNKEKTEEEVQIHVKHLKATHAKKKKQLEALGIDYEIPEFNLMPKVEVSDDDSLEEKIKETVAEASTEETENEESAAKAKTVKKKSNKRNETKKEGTETAEGSTKVSKPSAKENAAKPEVSKNKEIPPKPTKKKQKRDDAHEAVTSEIEETKKPAVESKKQSKSKKSISKLEPPSVGTPLKASETKKRKVESINDSETRLKVENSEKKLRKRKGKGGK